MARHFGSLVLLLLALFGYVVADHNCISMPTYCTNGALCHDNVATWSSSSTPPTPPSCLCNAPYTGTQCQTTVRDCHDTPCQNGGSCLPSTSILSSSAGDYFSCSCPKGFAGRLCEYPTPCASNPCMYGSTCNDASVGTSPALSCDCTPAFNYSHTFSGAWCQTATPTYECNTTRYSWAQPCQNGGVCTAPFVITTPPRPSTCACNGTQYGGPYCENIFCLSSPCQNGGTCRFGLCFCAAGFYGPTCQGSIKADFCASNPCQNGGNCTTTVSGLSGSCTCPLPFSGPYCQNAGFCASNPCQNGATCNELTQFSPPSCTCPSGYVGKYCSILANAFCNSSPCMNGGLCINATSDASLGRCDCTATVNYTGAFCQIPYVPTGCALSGCVYGNCNCYSRNTCISAQWNDNCVCPGVSNGISYGGTVCNVTTPTKCNYGSGYTSPCQHGGTCIDHRDGILCACLPGYYGSVCQNYANPCNPNPCQNGGACSSLLVSANTISGWTGIALSKSYFSVTCSCKYPYYGPTCASKAYGPNICPATSTLLTFPVATPICSGAPNFNGIYPNCYPQQFPFSTYTLYKGLVPYLSFQMLGFCQCLFSNMTGPNCDLDATVYKTSAYSGQITPANCSVANCQNGATCVNDTFGNFAYCGCRPGTTGKFCQFSATAFSMRLGGLVDTPDYCSANNPCNGGTCINLQGGAGFTCLCPPGFSSSVAASNSFTAASTVEFYCQLYKSFTSGTFAIVPSVLTLVVALLAAFFA